MAKYKIVTDSELFYAISQLIVGSKKTLILIYPSLSKIEHLLEKIKDLTDKDVKVFIVTRKLSGDESHQNALEFLKKLNCKIFIDNNVNAKMLITDQKQLLTSSADISKTANDRDFDFGIVTNDNRLIEKSLNYIERVMQIIDKKRKKQES
jgi:phosphatidylserine/phosphatidylglycerophosphate/cardiolipin synthase-like enzyme